jgi:DnaJ-class molecular chaperone
MGRRSAFVADDESPLEATSPRSRRGRTQIKSDPNLREVLDHLLDPLDALAGASGDGDLDAAQSGVQAGVSRGEDVYAPITLRAPEAQAGARPVIEYTLTDLCPHCGGSGRAHLRGQDSGTEPCANCQETGRVEAERRLRVRVPPGVEDGAQLRVIGEGSISAGPGTPGDLLLEVHVWTEPARSLATRYVSLALLMVAIVLLIYYLA